MKTNQVINKDNKLVVIAKPKIIHFNLPKDFRNNLKNEIDFIIKHNKYLAGQTIKN